MQPMTLTSSLRAGYFGAPTERERERERGPVTNKIADLNEHDVPDVVGTWDGPPIHYVRQWVAEPNWMGLPDPIHLDGWGVHPGVRAAADEIGKAEAYLADLREQRAGRELGKAELSRKLRERYRAPEDRPKAAKQLTEFDAETRFIDDLIADAAEGLQEAWRQFAGVVHRSGPEWDGLVGSASP
jgi:hypothetical protein